MKLWRTVATGAALIYALCVVGAAQNVGRIGVTLPQAGASNDPLDLPLLTGSPFVYHHEFQLPAGMDNASFSMAPAFNPANNSLFMTNRDDNVVEISIEAGNDVVASYLQTAVDITHGGLNNGGSYCPGGNNEIILGGMQVVNSQIIATWAPFYDSCQNPGVSVFFRKSSLTLTNNDVIGPYPADTTLPIRPGFVNGPMFAIPPNWQPTLGGATHIVGATMAAVIQGRSFGPAVSTIKAGDIGTVNPVPFTSLLYYLQGHQLNANGPGGPQYLDPNPAHWAFDALDSTVYEASTGDFNQRFADGSFTSNTSGTGDGAHLGAPSPWFDNGTNGFFMMMTPHSRTLLFLERQGSGGFCYGNDDDTGARCIDPPDNQIDPATGFGIHGGGTHGGHAWPWHYVLLAYDMRDLVAVQNGSKQPWEPLPYATWSLDMDGWEAGSNGRYWPLGAAYDAATGRFWLLDGYRAANGTPRVFEFHVDLGL